MPEFVHGALLQAKDIPRAERWFQQALQSGLKPDLLGAQCSLSGSESINPGSIYVSNSLITPVVVSLLGLVDTVCVCTIIHKHKQHLRRTRVTTYVTECISQVRIPSKVKQFQERSCCFFRYENC